MVDFFSCFPRIRRGSRGEDLDTGDLTVAPPVPAGGNIQVDQPDAARSRVSKAWTSIKSWFSRRFQAVACCGFSCRSAGSKGDRSESPGTSSESQSPLGRNTEVDRDGEHSAISDGHSANSDEAPDERATSSVVESSAGWNSVVNEDFVVGEVKREKTFEPPLLIPEPPDVDDLPAMERLAEKCVPQGYVISTLKLDLKGTLVLGGKPNKDDQRKVAALLKLTKAGANASAVEVMGEIGAADEPGLGQLLDLVKTPRIKIEASVQGKVDVRATNCLKLLMDLYAVDVKLNVLHGVAVHGTVGIDNGERLDLLLKLHEMNVNLQQVFIQGETNTKNLGELEALAEARMNLSQVAMSGEVDPLDLRRLPALVEAGLGLNCVTVAAAQNGIELDEKFTPRDLAALANAGLQVKELKVIAQPIDDKDGPQKAAKKRLINLRVRWLESPLAQ
jgi:hypothetical protein